MWRERVSLSMYASRSRYEQSNVLQFVCTCYYGVCVCVCVCVCVALARACVVIMPIYSACVRGDMPIDSDSR